MVERVRIHDVATRAGVSVTTVSHALSGRGKVSASTRSRVREIALELGYAPNRVASALRRRRTDVLGFVSDEIATTPFAGHIVLGAQEAAAERGMTLMVVNSNRDPDVERHQIAVLLAQQVDALVYATMFHRAVDPPRVPADVPLVLVNAEASRGSAPSVVPDEQGLAIRATRALLEAGHTRISHLTIAEPGFGVDGRLAGYRRTMQEAGLPHHVVAIGSGAANAAAGRAALERALDERPDLTAVFCFNDPMAMGVYQVAADRGLRIPTDLSVVGVDDLEIIAGQLRPGLTTLALPHTEMGRWAVRQAIGLSLGDAPHSEPHLQMACRLVERASIAPPAR